MEGRRLVARTLDALVDGIRDASSRRSTSDNGCMTVTRTKTGRVPMKAIRAVVDQIVAGWHPDKIILFGSHAYGKPTIDSDVDLLVIMPVEGNRAHLTGAMRAAIHVLFPIDLIVRTPEWIESRLAIDDQIVKEWLQEGSVLHESGS